MNTTQIEEEIKYRFDFNRNKKILKEKYQAKLLFPYNHGMWKADPVLLTLLQTCIEESEIVILDLYDNPIKVNPSELKQLAFDRWQEQMNAWEVEHSSMGTHR